MTSDIVRRPAWQLSKAIAARQLSCVEVVTAFLDQITNDEPTYHAFSSLRRREEVLADARVRDDELAAGRYYGWLHGLPHAVKDLSDVAGLRTSLGLFPPAEASIARHDELYVARLRSAGAVFTGKTNTPEFGLGSHTYNTITPTTLNALNPSRSAGGSSGGAAVAVARWMTPVADGSDFMGSLRNPPGWNGVIGLRPTFGRVPTSGDDPFTIGGGVEGPIARNARDLALLLVTMAGPDSRVPLSIAEDPAVLLRSFDEPLPPLRVGWLADFDGYLATEPGVLEVCSSTLTQLSEAGWHVEPASLPAVAGFSAVEQLWDAWVTFRASQVVPWILSVCATPELRSRIKPEAAWEVETYGRLTRAQLEEAAAVRSGVHRAFAELFETFDVLVLPTAQVFPFAASETWPAAIADRSMDTYHRWMEVTAPATMAGLPVLAFPAEARSADRAMGVQVIGPPRSEALLLRVAKAMEQMVLSDASEW